MSMRWASLVTGTQDRRAAGETGAAEPVRAFEAVRAGLGGRQDFAPAVVAGAGAVVAAPALPVRAGLGVRQDFAPAVVAGAGAVVAAPALPVRDETLLPFLTIGRPEAPDLDQALLIQRAGRGNRVRCATAEVTAFVAPGGNRRSVGFQVVEG